MGSVTSSSSSIAYRLENLTIRFRSSFPLLSQKYMLLAAGGTLIGGTVIGTALPWVGAIIFPSLPVAAAMGATTALIKVRSFRSLQSRPFAN